MYDQVLALEKFKFLLILPTSEEVLRQNITCLQTELRCFKKIKEKLNLEIWTVNFRSPCFGIDDGYKTELYSVPFPDLWKGFFCVCLIRPIFLKTFCQSQNWSTLLSDDGKFYSRTCSGVDLLSGVHTKRCQPLHLLSSSITEVNDWMQHALAKS